MWFRVRRVPSRPINQLISTCPPLETRSDLLQQKTCFRVHEDAWLINLINNVSDISISIIYNPQLMFQASQNEGKCSDQYRVGFRSCLTNWFWICRKLFSLRRSMSACFSVCWTPGFVSAVAETLNCQWAAATASVCVSNKLLCEVFDAFSIFLYFISFLWNHSRKKNTRRSLTSKTCWFYFLTFQRILYKTVWILIFVWNISVMS